MLESEEAAGAAEAGLDLVGDHQHAVLAADRGGLAQEAGGRDDHAGLALDGLEEERGGVGGDGGLQGGEIAEGDDLEARGEGAEALLVERLGREGDQGGGAAVEVVGADDDLGLVGGDLLHVVGPFAGGLDGGLDGFGARVHGDDPLEAGHLHQLLVKQGKLVVAEGARRQGDLGGLLGQGLEDAGMAVALVHRGVRAEAVQVPLALDIFDPDPLRTLDQHRQGMVVMGAQPVFEVDEFSGLRGGQHHGSPLNAEIRSLHYTKPRRQKGPRRLVPGRAIPRPRLPRRPGGRPSAWIPARSWPGSPPRPPPSRRCRSAPRR
ncbi:hypothetical protein D3C86_535520 [compost metagenome]